MDTSKTQLRFSPLFVLVAALFVTALLTSNIMAVKVISVAGKPLPAAIIIFPLSYILGDVLTEVYGYRQTRLVIWLGFICNLFMVVVFALGQWLPPASVWDGQDAYEAILGSTPRILAASFAAYLVGEFANSAILSRMKLLTNGKLLWTRTIGSTVIGQALDSTIFITLAFYGILPTPVLMQVIAVQWLVKVGYEVLATPLTYAVVTYLKRKEAVDAYDRDISLNPVALFK
ncbi:MAG: VUT family protein [Dehalococcoidia bacterium]|nr:VUT family protein [Dehalococcoidia bacterium]